jgi:ribonuclease E
VAVNDTPRDDPAHDPHLARLMAAVGDEQPPAALDAAIQAAARREVSARPQTAGGGTAAPVVRGKRNWYVPVSIAAVLVLSVSLVTLVHEEKGDELAQPKAPASVDARTQEAIPQSPPSLAQSPAPAGEVASSAPVDAAPAPAKAPESRRAEANQDRVFGKVEGAKTEVTAEPQRADAAKMAPPEASGETRQASSSAPVVATAPEAAPGVGGATPGAAPVITPPASQPPPAPMKPMLAKERQPEPFPLSAEREAPATAARTPSEPDAIAPQRPRVLRDAAPPPTIAAAPAPAPAPGVTAAPPPLAATQTEDARARSAPAMAQGRVAAAPPSSAMPEAKPMARPAAKPAASPPVTRPAWLNDLENQPPEKWLERLAEFKRDGRADDAETLLVEFRRRFPGHPASAR